MQHLPCSRSRAWQHPATAVHEHNHPQEEVWHIVEGSVEITTGNERHVAGPGMVAIVPANERHSVKAITAGKVIVADFPLRPDFG